MEPERSAGPELAARLANGRPLLLDGALGTELERRGASCALPLWSARPLLERPDLVLAIHREHAAAGAEILTANTFRTQRRTLAHAGLADRAAELTSLALSLAQRAAREAGEGSPNRRLFVAGSIAPLEDCWHPERVPADDALAGEHAAHAHHLADAGAELLLVETMGTIREAVAAASAARSTGLPTWVGFTCAPGARLLSGEALADALGAVLEIGPQAVLVNCLAIDDVAACLPALAACGLPFGVSPNLGAPDAPDPARRLAPRSPDAFAREAMGWLAAGARILGGCCGTEPAHVRAIADRLGR